MAHTPTLIDGVEVPSVTQVIGIVDKPFLRFWFGKHGTAKCEQIKQESAELGTHVHDAIEQILRGNNTPDTLTKREAEMVSLWQQWRDQSGFVATEMELKVISREFMYGGTFDAVGHFGNPAELWIGDWKTSNQIDELYGCQLAAYSRALREQTGQTVVGGFIVRLAKDPKKKPQLEVRQFDNLDRYFEVFQACLQVWRFQNKWGEWAA